MTEPECPSKSNLNTNNVDLKVLIAFLQHF